MKILIPVLVGSLIGYLTNWLAIKMLFKPHYEKKIFGVSLPFTPGLIPKERERMAENIGNAVGTHLLSSDTIIQAISSIENEVKIKNWLKGNIEKLRQQTMTIGDYLEGLIGEGYVDGKYNLKIKLSNFIIQLIRKEEVIDRFKTIIKDKIDNYDTSNLYDNIDIKINDGLNLLSNSDELKYELQKFLDKIMNEASNNSKTLAEVVPSDIYTSIDNYLDEHKDEIGDNLRYILKDEEVKNKIKDAISNLVFDRSNKLLMAFISPDMISEKIFESIEKYIDKRETNEDIIEIIKFLIEKIKGKTVSSISLSVLKVVDKNSIKLISSEIIKHILSVENIEKIQMRAIDFLKENERLNKENLNKYLNIAFENIIYSEDIENKINSIVSSTIEDTLNKTISDLLSGLSDERLTNIYNFSKRIFTQFAGNKLPEMITMLNVSKIVEDKINSFEIDYTEKLILDIAKKELNQITRLGALLGGILGLLSPFLQYIY